MSFVIIGRKRRDGENGVCGMFFLGRNNAP